MRQLSISIGALVVVLFLLWFLLSLKDRADNSVSSFAPIASVSYTCDQGKTIQASYYQGEPQPSSADQPPTPTGSVVLVLGDGRTTALPQTISADGARYANADESFVFWSKGSGAFIEEKGSQTYGNCVGTQVEKGTPVLLGYDAFTCADGTTFTENIYGKREDEPPTFVDLVFSGKPKVTLTPSGDSRWKSADGAISLEEGIGCSMNLTQNGKLQECISSGCD